MPRSWPRFPFLRRYEPPAEMYLRFDRIDAITGAFADLKHRTEHELHKLQQAVRDLPAAIQAELSELLSRGRPAPSGGGVTREDIIASIEMLFGFTPDEGLVDYNAKLGFSNRFSLGEYMVNTDEFCRRYTKARGQIVLGERILAKTHRNDLIYLIAQDTDLTPIILRCGRFEAHVEHAIRASVHAGARVIDLGANVGYHTLAIAAAVGPRGFVHAFEANPAITPLLKDTIYINQLQNVTVHECAVLDRPGEITLASHPERYASGHVGSAKPHPAYPNRVTVPAVALDDALAEQLETVDFIHMDIEGSEPLALRGAEALIRRSPQLRIVTEWSTVMMRSRVDVAAHIRWLAAQDFDFWWIRDSGGSAVLSRVPIDELSRLPHSDLLLCRGEPPVALPQVERDCRVSGIP